MEYGRDVQHAETPPAHAVRTRRALRPFRPRRLPRCSSAGIMPCPCFPVARKSVWDAQGDLGIRKVATAGREGQGHHTEMM